MSPISNDFVATEKANAMEPFYPLRTHVCHKCWLVQLPAVQSADNIFRDDYAYFSSMSKSWLEHAERYVAQMTERFGLNEDNYVVEVASNDGYLLQYFHQRGVPVLGIEPCANVAEAGEKVGVPALVEFFGTELAGKLAAEGRKPDLIVGNNVLAHVPDLRDFVRGLQMLVGDGGVITMEFPHLQKLVELNQFDTIYHEHFSYFSMTAVADVFKRQGLRIFDVEELPTHGGSLRIYGCHANDADKPTASSVTDLLEREDKAGFKTLDLYRSFEEKVHRTKRELLKFLIAAREDGKTVVGYGAPAKGNTLLNYCGVRTDLIEFTVDRAASKQNTLLPGVRIPVYEPDRIRDAKPDYLLILPWNIKDEIMVNMDFVREWGCRFVVPIPAVQLLD
jgi:2-polyprenyl-3-methyl-5-hydroxy-6-metoxy-1,4-benzoquinol methylase